MEGVILPSGDPFLEGLELPDRGVPVFLGFSYHLSDMAGWADGFRLDERGLVAELTIRTGCEALFKAPRFSAAVSRSPMDCIADSWLVCVSLVGPRP